MATLPLAAAQTAHAAQASAAMSTAVQAALAYVARLLPTVQQQIYAETDARFWAQTAYKVGQKLDPSLPADAAMIPVYDSVLAKVAGEYRAHGYVVPTAASPVVQQNLAAAASAHAQAAQHVAASVDASAADDHAAARQHAAAASALHKAATQHAIAAAATQPVSVRPGHVQQQAGIAVATTPDPNAIAAPPATTGNLQPAQKHAWSDADKAAAQQALVDVLNATHAADTALAIDAQAKAQAASAGQAPGTPTATTRPPRDPNYDHEPPRTDAQGRVEQPDAAKPWIAFAVVAACVGGIAAAVNASGKQRTRRGRGKRSGPRPTSRGEALLRRRSIPTRQRF